MEYTASDLERQTEKATRSRRKIWSDLGRRRHSEKGEERNGHKGKTNERRVSE
jgi:hypothetical protein